ncbi:MAG: hypothetical protein KAS05_02930 [Candidatus Omnitrophica bacterium]|nr:hypothetical protein [Candidatus Omnitrophota bacterium]
MIKMIVTFILIFLVFPSFVYSQSEYKDPFKSALPQGIEEVENIVERQEEMGEEREDVLLNMVVQGILLEGNFPQAIIDGEVYKAGDRLKDMNGKVFRIGKSAVFISYGEKIYRIKIKKKEGL